MKHIKAPDRVDHDSTPSFRTTVRRVFPDDPSIDKTGILSTLRRRPLPHPTVSCRFCWGLLMSAAPLSRLMKLLAVYTFFRFCQARKACFAAKWLKIIRMSAKWKNFGTIFVENRESLRPAVGELEQAAEKLAPREVRYALAREQRERRDRRAVCVENVERAERLALLDGRINVLGQ